MKKMITLGLILFAVFAISSCTTFKLSGIQMNDSMPSYTSVGEFSTSIQVWEFVGTPGGTNLANITATNMDTQIYDTVRREISKYSGDAAVNVTIEYKATLIDLLISGVTGGLAVPAHAEISGTVVKYSE